MSAPIHLVVPMSGQGLRFQQAGYTQPKPLIDVNGVPMIERVLSCFPLDWPSFFVLAENHRATALPAALEALRPQGVVEAVAPHREGPGRALRAVLPRLPPDAPVFVSYCDYGMVWDARQFERFVRQSDCDACVVSYRGFHPHYLNPLTYAYSRLEGGLVREVREKGSFTADREQEFASAGGYYFKSARLLAEALRRQEDDGLTLKGESYTSLTVEALLRARPGARVTVFEIPAFFQWGTPEELERFVFFEQGFAAKNRFLGASLEVEQVLMPMAGRGSRFSSSTPKPLLPVAGQPMFKAALASLPRARRTVVVGLEAFEPQVVPHLGPATTLVSLPRTPEGQALSTGAGLDALSPQGDVIVSACDHGIVLDPELWAAFRTDPRCEAAIFTIAGFPGAARRPEAYAYVVPAPGSGPVREVAQVSVKRPVSQTPWKDALLVGTFWFESRDVLRRGIDLLTAADKRVNGELYLDSVFELLLGQGLRVRSIPLGGYLCWGEPEALAESLYWQECFGGAGLVPRPRHPGVL